jgi:hypothetical protein
MAAGDVVIQSVTNRAIRGVRVVTGTVQLDGTNPTPVALAPYMSACLGGVVSMEGATAPGVDPTAVTSAASGSTLNVYAWKITATGDGTLIASTNATRLVHFVAWGTP